MSRVSRARRSKDATESSKMSGIINAHKPMPLSDLFHSAATPETVESIARRKKHTQLGLGLLLLIVLLGATSVVYKHAMGKPSTAWMDNPLVASLLTKTPKTKNDEYVVFVTHSNGQDTEVHYGTSPQSPEVALQKAFKKCRLLNKVPTATERQYYIKVDAVQSLHHYSDFNYSEDHPPPLSGFAIGDWSSMVYIYDQIEASALVDRHGSMRWDHIGKVWTAASQKERHRLPNQRAKWPSEINLQDSTVSIDFFETEAVFIKNNDEAYPLSKGRRAWTPQDVTPSNLRASAQAAGDYLIRQMHSDGRMAYLYKPRSDSEADDDYNLTRHAGTAYAMAVLYKEKKDPRLLSALEAALDYLVDVKMTACPIAYDASASTTTARCIVNEVYQHHKWTSLGVNALSLLAMAEYMAATSDTLRYGQACSDLATWIAGTQREDGSFVQDQDIESNKLDEASYVRYYPGEAAFGLARYINVATSLGVVTSQSKAMFDGWRSVANNAMVFVLNRESDVEDVDFVNDHWMMMAMAEMASWHEHVKVKSMLKFALRTGHVASDRQVRHHEDANADHNGIYTYLNGEDVQSLSSMATATKSEGLCAVYAPLILQHKEDESSLFLESLLQGTRYQLSTQFGPEWSMYLRKPQKIVGAFSKSIVQTETRNDYAQHNIVSMLCLAQVLEKHGYGAAAAQLL